MMTLHCHPSCHHCHHHSNSFQLKLFASSTYIHTRSMTSFHFVVVLCKGFRSFVTMPLWTLICICRCAIKFVEVYVAYILQLGKCCALIFKTQVDPVEVISFVKIFLVLTEKFGHYIESKNLY
jgi:hypothetical protein